MSCDLSAITSPCCVASVLSMSAVLTPSCCQPFVSDYVTFVSTAVVNGEMSKDEMPTVA